VLLFCVAGRSYLNDSSILQRYRATIFLEILHSQFFKMSVSITHSVAYILRNLNIFDLGNLVKHKYAIWVAKQERNFFQSTII
jgi:hypothetical protein